MTRTSAPRSEGPLACLFAPVDIASLVFVRIAFGGVMVWEVFRYFQHGWVESYWVKPPFHFPYPLFEWVTPWPGDGMYLHFVLLGAMALCVMIGQFYRVSATLLWLLFTYIFLLEEARYLNHFYLVSLISFLMIFVPAHRAFSLDARLRPEVRSNTAPAWCLWLIRLQVGIPYLYGGIAKLNSDWLRGAPMREWLAKRDDFPVIGRWFGTPFAAYFFSWSGLLIDLLAVPLLLWKRTRLAMFVFLAFFHFTNSRLFNIGIFPWFMLGATSVFLPPDWPRRVQAACLDRRGRSWTMLGALVGATLSIVARQGLESFPLFVGAFAGVVVVTLLRRTAAEDPPEMRPYVSGVSRSVVVCALALWTIPQLVLPFRHHLIPGNVAWTEEGHRFSWRMKLRGKIGRVRFVVTNPDDGTNFIVDPDDRLKEWQLRKMGTRPYMIHQYAHEIARYVREERGWERVEVRADARARLNGRPWRRLIDQSVDLAAEPRRVMTHAPWILTLDAPLPPFPKRDE